MCTVIYIPSESGAYMCSVRDENPMRERAHFPKKITEKQAAFWAPIDPKGGGTWWTMNETGDLTILLNGAFHNHLPNTRSYRKSRGLIVIELSQEANFKNAWENLDLNDIEPFTLVHKSTDKLIECRWNGTNKFWKEVAIDQPHIWSSATLYPLEVRRKRELLFYEFLKTPVSKALEIEPFLFKYAEPVNGFIMHRLETLRSLSVSIMDIRKSSAEIYYHDLLSEKHQSNTISLKKV